MAFRRSPVRSRSGPPKRAKGQGSPGNRVPLSCLRGLLRQFEPWSGPGMADARCRPQHRNRSARTARLQPKSVLHAGSARGLPPGWHTWGSWPGGPRPRPTRCGNPHRHLGHPRLGMSVRLAISHTSPCSVGGGKHVAPEETASPTGYHRNPGAPVVLVWLWLHREARPVHGRRGSSVGRHRGQVASRHQHPGHDHQSTRGRGTCRQASRRRDGRGHGGGGRRRRCPRHHRVRTRCLAGRGGDQHGCLRIERGRDDPGLRGRRCPEDQLAGPDGQGESGRGGPLRWRGPAFRGGRRQRRHDRRASRPAVRPSGRRRQERAGVDRARHRGEVHHQDRQQGGAFLRSRVAGSRCAFGQGPGEDGRVPGERRQRRGPGRLIGDLPARRGGPGVRARRPRLRSINKSGFGSLADVAAKGAPGSTCQRLASLADLPDVTAAEKTILKSLSLKVDALPWIDISGKATPKLPQDGGVEVKYTYLVENLQPGLRGLYVRATGVDSGGEGSVETCMGVKVADISLVPSQHTSELGIPGQTHTVVATVGDGIDGGVPGVQVSFHITKGPNVGGMSTMATGADGKASFTYTARQHLAGLGTDVIVACFTDDQGTNASPRRPTWRDPRRQFPPARPGRTRAATYRSTNSGFYGLMAVDAVDPDPQVFLRDAGSGIVFGPYKSGIAVKITQAPGASPNQKAMAGAVTWHITGKGDAQIHARDAVGNVSTAISCSVPPKKK